MTTAPTPAPGPSRQARPYGAAALGLAVLAGSAAGAAAAVAGLVIGGGSGALGALVGAGVALLVLATGFAVVDLVAGLLPAASLLVAVLTYSLQLGLLALLLAAFRGSDDVADVVDARWLAVGVIAVALAWTVCLVVHAMRARVPLYDLPERTPEGSDR